MHTEMNKWARKLFVRQHRAKRQMRRWTNKVRRGMYCCTNKKNTICQDQLSFAAMQVTSSHVSIWCHLLASYDEYTALVKFGNVASEHVK